MKRTLDSMRISISSIITVQEYICMLMITFFYILSLLQLKLYWHISSCWVLYLHLPFFLVLYTSFSNIWTKLSCAQACSNRCNIWNKFSLGFSQCIFNILLFPHLPPNLWLYRPLFVVYVGVIWFSLITLSFPRKWCFYLCTALLLESATISTLYSGNDCIVQQCFTF